MFSMPFYSLGSNTAVAATTTSASGTISTTGKQVLVHNSGTTLAFVKFGLGSATATTSDVPVPAGALVLLSVAEAFDKAAAIYATGSGTVYFMRGNGI